jgi:uncharacterized membrane protein YcaP (DUF421 family)
MVETVTQLFGEGPSLTWTQMALRAFVMFFIILILIRFTGIRIFGTGSGFDNVVTIVLGSILSRGIVGASPFWSVVAAATVICIVHKIMARAGFHNHFVNLLIKGRQLELYKNGRINHDNLKQIRLTENDLMGEIRSKVHLNTLKQIKEVYRERTGEISVVLQD